MTSRLSKKLTAFMLILVLICGVFSGFYESTAVRAEESADTEPDDTEKQENASDDIREFRAVWIAYYDFEDAVDLGRQGFRNFVCEMFDNAVSFGFNAVVVHVRPFSDAMYKSEYFPWSSYASGKQGINPGYDPLAVMCEEAHARDLEIHAWINPYRVTGSWNYGTDVSGLSKKNPARKWLTNKKTSDDRYVLEQDGALYYNPSVSAVRKLIVNGVREIVENYDVDGIHFDDYFYPDLSSEYASEFDAEEYEAYKEKRQKAGKKPLSIVYWRYNNVNTLIKEVYSAIKEINSNVVFGISPGGYIDYLDDVDGGYVDYRTWMKDDGYIDYICPQLYWTFNSKNIFPFYETMLEWASHLKNSNVRLYIGLPAYKMNTNTVVSSKDSSIDTEWYNQFLLADMILYLRRSNVASGFIVFDYSDLITEKNRKATEYMRDEILRG